MHAASVNPEPGSNSLKKFYIISSELIPFFQSYYLSFFLLLLLSISFFKVLLTRSLHFSVPEISCCSIFNEQFLPHEVEPLHFIIYFSVCQVVFHHFLKKNYFYSISLLKCFILPFIICNIQDKINTEQGRN